MEPTPPELGAATGSPHGLIVESREELLYLLGEAAEFAALGERLVSAATTFPSAPPTRPRSG